MYFLPIIDIIINERIRRENADKIVDDLADSISTVGLLHAVVVRNGNQLVAGETRIKAIRALHDQGIGFNYGGQLVPVDCVPCVDIGELSEVEALEAEIEENIRRLDIHWTDHVVGVQRLHKLRQMQNPSHTLEDTAREVYVNATARPPSSRVRESIEIANQLDDPEVRNAPSERAAHRIVLAKVGREFASELARRTILNEASPYTLLEGDCIPHLMSMEGRFDIILTDPPYGQDSHQIDSRVSIIHTYDDRWKTVEELLYNFSRASYFATQPDAHLYMFCAVRHFIALDQMFTSAGWHVWPTPLIWAKNVGHMPNIDFGPSRRYECILYAIKGQRRVTQIGTGDVLTHPIETQIEFAAAKPVSLFEELLRRSAIEQLSNVCDPFAGSGTIFPAAHPLHIRATGIEKDEHALKFCRQRLLNLAQPTQPE